MITLLEMAQGAADPPVSGLAWALAGEVYYRLGRWEQALASTRRANEIPLAVTITVPGPAQGFECAVLGFEPLAELGLGGRAIALVRAPLVPEIVAQQGGVTAIALDQ